MGREKGVIRLAAIGDVHCTKNSQGTLQPLFAEISETADILVMCGDLVDYGLPEEAQVLVKELAIAKIPKVAVLGNHDYECGRPQEVKDILCEAGVQILDADAVEIQGIGFAGVKGFGGGFDERALQPWGEQAIKDYVQEAVNEALRLESALARLRTKQKIALMHYSPIRETVEGESLEIFPFLGSSRLEEPINRYRVTAAFHGHAHHGHPEGRTKMDIPVYNVSIPLLRRTYPDRPPFRIFEIKVSEATGELMSGELASSQART